MRSKLLFLIVLILAMTALPVTVQANVAVNESFEDPSPASWSEWSSSASYGGTGTTTYHENDPCFPARTGEDCMETSGGEFAFSYQDFDTFVIGETYTLAAYFKDNEPTGSTGEAFLMFEYRDGPRGTDENKISTPIFETAIPNDGNWHLVQLADTVPSGTQLITICVGTGYGSASANYLYDDVWFDDYAPGGASNPQPVHNSKVQAPGTVDLKWENLSAQTCQVYWNDGNNDVNDINFQYHVGNNLGTKVYLIGTVANEDPNEVLNNIIAAAKNYYWRVDVGTIPGVAWKFSTINDAPEVDAGLKQAKWQDDLIIPSPVTFDLTPTVSDDGLPIPPGAVIYKWTATDPCNPGAVVFNPGGAVSTDPAPTATMTVAGDYIIDLEVSDGTIPPILPALSSTDWVKLRVHANATTGLEARYDCEEADAGPNIHDDYSGYARNPGQAAG